MKRITVTLLSFGAAALLAGAAPATAATASHGLMKGLDGGLYLPYKPSVVRKTQQSLEQKGLYNGTVDGRLGASTMRATADFQKRNGIHASGVPSPRTRHALAMK